MSPAPQRIIVERIDRPRDRVVFWALTAIVAATVVAVGLYWWSLRDHHPVLFALISGLLIFHLAVWSGRWFTLLNMRAPVPLAPEAGMSVAAVTTFHPGSEPLEMLERTVQALVAMRYPHDTWVLDEGDTGEVKALCNRLGVQHYTRFHKTEYQDQTGPFQAETKHGNYNAWLRDVGYSRYDYLVAFDTDHIPEPAFLDRVLGYFRDPGVGYVQTPQVYYNQSASFIARGAAEETYAYYSSHQMASYAVGHPILTGCHNAQRLRALREVGSIPAHDAEDLLLTLRYRAHGWRGVYIPEILALGTTPVDWAGYLRQQMRWARAVLDIKIREYPKLMWKLPPVERAAGFLHGLYYLRALTFPFLYGLVAWLVATGVEPAFVSWAALGRVGLAALAIATADRFRQNFYLDPRREAGLHWRALLLQFAKWPFLMLAAWRALLGPPRVYDATQKARRNPASTNFAMVHIAIAGVMSAAWLVGIEWSHVSTPMTIICLTIVLLSVTLAWTATWQYPQPFDTDLADRRSAVLSDLFEGRLRSTPHKPVERKSVVSVNRGEELGVLGNGRQEGSLRLTPGSDDSRNNMRDRFRTQL
jgi:cellulose synthase (UDP-forming)